MGIFGADAQTTQYKHTYKDGESKDTKENQPQKAESWAKGRLCFQSRSDVFMIEFVILCSLDHRVEISF
jgi:hypothetical protein